MVYGYHIEFLQAQGMDPVDLESLPDEIRIEILSTLDMEYAVWRSTRELEIGKTVSQKMKEDEAI